MPKKRRYLDDNPPQDTIKKDPAYKSLSERIMYRFWDGSPNDLYKAIDADKDSGFFNNRRVVDEFLGGAPQRTYFLNRKKQKQSMLYNGYIEGKEKDYGLVKKAVGNRNLPVYQTASDVIDRDYLVPIANVNNTWYGSNTSELRHPGSYPSTVYVDGRTGNTFYQKAWDLNDYGPKNGGESIKNSNWFAKARAAFADAVGSPIVQTTGYQQVEKTRNRIPQEVQEMYNNYLADHGLHIQDGLISLPEVHVRARRLKDGGRIYIKPENRGKFTALKERTGHSASWFKENGTPAQKKMAVFALNSRKWKH